MKNLLFKLIIIVLFISSLFSAFIEQNTGWSYIQSTNQAFYFFVSQMDIVNATGNTIEGYGDGSNGQTYAASDCGLDPSSCDVVGAFTTYEYELNEDGTDGAPFNESTCDEVDGYYQNNQCEVCVGWSYYNSYSETNSGSIATTLAMMGFDNSNSGDYNYYCHNDDIPNLKYYDASEGIIYSLTSNIELGSFNNNLMYLYWPDCEGIDDCLEVHFVAAEDDALSNEDLDEFPNSFEIVNIYPNPFNPSTQIEYMLSSIEYINISVYDTVGRHIVTLFNGFQDIGNHELTWSPESSISSGSYIIKVETLNDLLTSKVTYLK